MAMGMLMMIIKMVFMISLLAALRVIKLNNKMSSVIPFANTAKKMKKALKTISLSILLMAKSKNMPVPPHSDVLAICFAVVKIKISLSDFIV